MHTEFWSESLKRRGHSEDLGLDGNITLEWILGKEPGYLSGIALGYGLDNRGF
jgi:hypothetical protein